MITIIKVTMNCRCTNCIVELTEHVHGGVIPGLLEAVTAFTVPHTCPMVMNDVNLCLECRFNKQNIIASLPHYMLWDEVWLVGVLAFANSTTIRFFKEHFTRT